MMIYLRSAVTILLLTFCFMCMAIFVVHAQPKKWADVSPETLEMQSYSPDSSASAVVLFDKGHLRVEDNLEYYLDRHVRIKILNEEGYKWATVELDYNKEYDQEIDDIKAATYVFGNEGNKIREYEVADESIFKEVIINDWNRLKFTFPSLEPGCVIEYRYTQKIGDPSYIPVWYFDWSIPVVWNELQAEFPAFLRFTKVFSGYEELDKNEWEEFSKTIRINYQTDDKSLYGLATGGRREGSINFNGEKFRWLAKNRKAVRPVPFMTTENDYKSKVRFQLSEFNIPNKVQEDYAKRWADVIDHILNDDDFGTYLNPQDEYEQIIASLKLGDKLPKEQLKLLYNFISDSYTWDKTYGIYGEHSVKDISETLKGSGTELNLMLTGLLQQAHFNAYPVLISTREHGSVSEEYVLPNQFNHVITFVKLKDEEFLLDASQGKRSIYLLPSNDLNGKGLVVKRVNPGSEQWASLIPLRNTIRATSLHANISPDGSLNGRVSGKSTGYFAYEDRKLITERGEDTFLDEILFDGFSEFQTSRLSIENATELDSTLGYTSFLHSAKAFETQVVDSTIYLDAIPIMKWSENPFKQDKRDYPIDFTYPYSEQLVITYQIPWGYKVVDYPDNLTTRIPKKGGMFSRTVEVKDRRIILRSHIELGRSRYSVSEYERLKLFFDQIIDAHSEKIVLKKSTES